MHTGKSVVRKMLEHLGAYGIDADALADRAIAKGAPGYEEVVDLFGKWILDENGQIDRTKLSRLVFNHQEALDRLELIVHPLVSQAIDILVRRSKHSVVVVEAIKLIESGLMGKCDALWVTYAPQELQLSRLMQKRNMNEKSARLRINVQSEQEEKTRVADVVIENDGSFERTWRQVNEAWQRVFPSAGVQAALAGEHLIETDQEHINILRARPREAEEIAQLITQLSRGHRLLRREDVMAAFGEKAFLLLRVNGKAVGVVGWKVENLVARTDDVYLDSSLEIMDALGALMAEVERASQELQCEISLLFLPAYYRHYHTDLSSHGLSAANDQKSWRERLGRGCHGIDALRRNHAI